MTFKHTIFMGAFILSGALGYLSPIAGSLIALGTLSLAGLMEYFSHSVQLISRKEANLDSIRLHKLYTDFEALKLQLNSIQGLGRR
jgi:hypothetical protein